MSKGSKEHSLGLRNELARNHICLYDVLCMKNCLDNENHLFQFHHTLLGWIEEEVNVEDWLEGLSIMTVADT